MVNQSSGVLSGRFSVISRRQLFSSVTMLCSLMATPGKFNAATSRVATSRRSRPVFVGGLLPVAQVREAGLRAGAQRDDEEVVELLLVNRDLRLDAKRL